MYAHHRETIDRVVAKLREREETLAILVGGSIAHGFERADSDVDIFIVVPDEVVQRRRAEATLNYVESESATYEGGYVDGKYVSTEFIRAVAERGSEPARFAFHGSFVAWSRIDGLEALVREASRYPVADKQARLRTFYAQLEAWRWFCDESRRLGNDYALGLSASNLVLFAGRLILTENEVLYPFHKWFLRVLAGVERKPATLMDLIDAVVARHDAAATEALYRAVADFAEWPGKGRNWGDRFMLDTELAWLDGRAAVAEL